MSLLGCFLGLCSLTLIVSAVCPTTLQLQGLTGTVINRENSTFSSATLDWNQAYFAKQEACIVVFCHTKYDVVNSLKWVQQMNIPFRIRAGRHSYEGYSVPQDGLVIDLSNLNQKSYDPETSVSTFGAGLRLFQVTDYLMNFGRLFPGGTCPSVGLSGYILGGGYGWFSRHYGLGVDAVRELEIVLPNGEIVIANSSHNTDLFWACRGAGHGNFGVITQFKLQTYPIPEKFSMFRMAFPRTNSVKVFDLWQRQASLEDTSLMCSLYIYADGKIDIMGLYLNDQKRLFELDFVKLLLTFNPNVTMNRDMTFDQVSLNLAGCSDSDACLQQALSQPSLTEPIHWKSKTLYAQRPVSIELIDSLLTFMKKNTSSDYSVLILDPYGGVINSVPSTQTAFPHRSMLYSVQFMNYWSDDANGKAAHDWINLVFGDIKDNFSPFSYVNYIDRDLENWAYSYYGTNLPRLQQIKCNVDRKNVFRNAQGFLCDS